MADYSDSFTEAQQLMGELRWLLPDGKLTDAKLKALRLEQCARALLEAIKRMEVKTDARTTHPKQMYGHFPPFE